MKSKLVIIQPALGRYRKGFIESLVDINGEFEISIFCSPVDNAGVRSMENIDASIDYRKVRITSFFGIFFWQHLFISILKLNLKDGDALVINGNPRFLSSLIVSFVAKFNGAEIYWWGHAWSSTSSSLGSFIRFKLMSFFKIILYTDEELERASYRIKSPVVALNNGLDVKSIRKNISIDESKYDRSGLELVFIGRYTKKSNFELIIEALLLIPEENIKLKVVGDISYVNIIKNYPEASALNIQCYGEIWDENQISDILKDSHVFVYPGSVGLSLIHAFAIGLPAILHDKRSAHMPEIGAFEENKNGLSFRYGSAKSLSETIVFCNDNKDIIRTYSQNAYSTVSDSFNTQDMAERFMKFIKEQK